MPLSEALALLTDTTAIATQTSTEMLLLAYPDSGSHMDLDLMRISLDSAQVLESFSFAQYQDHLADVLAEITTYAQEHGFDTINWEQLAVSGW